MAVSRHLWFYETANSAIRPSDPENPRQEPNMEWITCSIAPFARYSRLNYTLTLKLGFGDTQGHRRRHCWIEHIRLYIRTGQNITPPLSGSNKNICFLQVAGNLSTVTQTAIPAVVNIVVIRRAVGGRESKTGRQWGCRRHIVAVAAIDDGRCQEAGVKVRVDYVQVVWRNVGDVVCRLQRTVYPEEPLGRSRCQPTPDKSFIHEKKIKIREQ